MATVAGGDIPQQQYIREYRPGANMQRIGNYFGLAMKAGKVAAGDMVAVKALKTDKAHLLVLAEDTSHAVLREIIPLAEKHCLPLLWWPDKNSLGLAVGKSRRGALVVLDKGFSEAILKFCFEII